MTSANEVRMEWRGPLSDALVDTTAYLDVEGAIRSGKTTMALWKVLSSCLANPGIKWLMARWTDDMLKTQLRPAWRAVCEEAGVLCDWHADESYDKLPNGALVYLRGLKPSDDNQRYGKFRGLTLAGIYVDQAEEIPTSDYLAELQGRLSQKGFPHQLVLTPNPPSKDHWLAKQFPVVGIKDGYRYIRVPLKANAHNLDPETVRRLHETFPAGSAKHRTMIQGLRGLNVTGKPVYGADPDSGEAGSFEADRHLLEKLDMHPGLPLLEGMDWGKHHPCIVWAQNNTWGGLDFLGGVLGRDLKLSQFVPIVQQYRAAWFDQPLEIRTCCDDAGTYDNSHGTQTAKEFLAEKGIYVRALPGSNQPALRTAAVERLADLMTQRSAGHELFRCHKSRWVVVGANDVETDPFVPEAFEAGYVWDEHRRTVGNKQVAVPHQDGWYDHGMNCCEYIMLNFGHARVSERDIQREAAKTANAALRRAQKDHDPYDQTQRPQRAGRGGY